jgi:hypothetical protein
LESSQQSVHLVGDTLNRLSQESSFYPSNDKGHLKLCDLET